MAADVTDQTLPPERVPNLDRTPTARAIEPRAAGVLD
jgi:hypothetical protein